jgi:gliding motility-associated-like protein
MKKVTLLFFFFISLSCFAQLSKTHYIPPLTSQTNLAEDQYLYISTPNPNNVNFKIIEIGRTIITGVVSNTKPYELYIGKGNNTQLLTPKTTIGIVQNKGYIVEAEDLVYVNIRLTATKNIRDGITSYAHAGGLVSKGNSALGTMFRLGAMFNPLYDSSLLNFASILSTENNTKVTISNILDGTIFTDGTVYNGPIIVTLNKNESYVLALENSADNNVPSNSSKMIGASVESDKPVVVNSGSLAGSNSSILALNQNQVLAPTGRDVGFDQIVSYEKTGKEYIFVKGWGTDELERVLLIANMPQTDVYINGNSTPFTTLVNPGDYVAIDGSQFSNENLYVSTSENVFAYQSIGGSAFAANQNMFFVPPLNCATPNTVDNIPFIESIGTTTFNGGLNIVTETSANVLINGNPIGSFPIAITGNTGFVRYTINSLFGNITIKSDKQVYVSYFGSNGAATYGGYYSGFDLKPEIVSDKLSIQNSACIPNVILKINSVSSYDTFQWYENDVAILGATSNQYPPSNPGYYQVRGGISGCPSNGFIFSDKIPVSECPTNLDNDKANDNIDIDNDNDGITNCTESYGNKDINISNQNAGNISVGNYSNSFTGAVSTTGTGLPAGTFSGNTDGSFVTEIPGGKDNSITYTMTFTQPISLGMEYVSTANPSDLLNADAEYVINSDIDKTITVLNPDDQLSIDTNYDGIYESEITQYSSFEIRFRLNSATPLAAGKGTFQFLTYLTNTISITHKNLSETNPNKSTIKFFATCVPKHSDNDGTPDQLDSDSDNDGILDIIEAQVNNPPSLSNLDTNNNGLDNSFEPGLTPVDTDKDGVFDYLDLDSDNDGILDSVETEIDTDADGIRNYRDLDSDNDSCKDVVEAGFTDPDSDGEYGNLPINVDLNGLISGAPYSIPNPNYISSAPIVIATQPIVTPTCEFQDATITLVDNGGNTYQWQISTNGITWNNIINNATYSGAATNELTITSVTNGMNGYKYRVQLNKTGNSCGLLSAETKLTVYALPVVNDISIVQCGTDLLGVSTFNLTVKNNEISSNFANETFTYYKTLAAANTADNSQPITTPLAFVNTTPGTMHIWARIVNTNGCYRVSKITLKVSTTQINSATFHRNFDICDDSKPSDTDGFSEFDFHTVTSDIQNILPSPSSDYSIKYYETEANALSEINEVTTISNYRNTIINKQDIWVRIDSNLDNACFGLGPFITLNVNPLPKINLNTDGSQDEIVCSNLPTFFVQLNAGIQDSPPTTNYTYVWSKDGAILPEKKAYTLDVNAEGTYTVEVRNFSGCSRIRTLKVTASDMAYIQDIVIVDMVDVNTVTVNVTGTGNYEYSLNDASGNFQDSNFFTNVPAGVHDVFIQDKNGCGVISKTIAVIGAPKFFTPNNDGYNDYWSVKGVTPTFNSKSIIYIFDRYGKLLKQWALSSSESWDGTFSGAALPADDYWFTLKLEDGREAKGNFSLKR